MRNDGAIGGGGDGANNYARNIGYKSCCGICGEA